MYTTAIITCMVRCLQLPRKSLAGSRQGFDRHVYVGVYTSFTHSLRLHETAVNDVGLIADRALFCRVEKVVPRLWWF